MDLIEFRRNIARPLILDGAMGSMLQNLDLVQEDSLWASRANKTDFEAVKRIHKGYINSGAEIITTNTFRTNPLAVLQSKYPGNFDSLVMLGLKAAKEAVIESGKKIFIAGSNAPAEDCYQKDVAFDFEFIKKNHSEHIISLMENGADFILNETHGQLPEILFISEFCNKYKIPFVMSIFFDDNLKLHSGEYVPNILSNILQFNPLAISFNCIKINAFSKLTSEINLDFPWGIYLNVGKGNHNDRVITCDVSPEYYWNSISQLINTNCQFVGACCGSSELHIKRIAEGLNAN